MTPKNLKIVQFLQLSTLKKELAQLDRRTMWFDLRDVPRPNDIPPWSTTTVTSGEHYWYDSLMSARLYASFGPNAAGGSNLDNTDASGSLMMGADGRYIGYERNCAVTNYDNDGSGIWDDRECTEQNCHVCAQGWGDLWQVNTGPDSTDIPQYHDYGDDDTGVDEFGAGDDSDAVFYIIL